MSLITDNPAMSIATFVVILVVVLGASSAGYRLVDGILARIAQTLLVLAALLGFTLAFIVCADVGGRYFFNSPIQGTPELISMAIVMICYLQAAYAIRSGGMISVDAIYIHMPVRVKALVIGSLTYLLLAIKQMGAFFHGELPPTASSSH